MAQPEAKIALLIDADNAPASKIEAILTEISSYGEANIRRAYGNWTSPFLKSWQENLYDYAIRPIQQFDYTKGKNATDAALIIDAMDLLYTQSLDAFAIVSSDCDFTPLVMRIRTNGLKVYGFGENKTPAAFINACSKFLYLENIGQDADSGSVTSAKTKMSTIELKQDTKLVNLLRGAVDAVQEEDGWAGLSSVGTHISNQASFDPRNYGYSKLSYLFEAIDLFDIQRRGNLVYVRDKRKSNPAPGKSLK